MSTTNYETSAFDSGMEAAYAGRDRANNPFRGEGQPWATLAAKWDEGYVRAIGVTQR